MHKEIEDLVREAHYKKEYRPVAVAIIKDAAERVLFVQSGKNQREWYFPQGGIEPGEDFATALFRELKEELGIQKDSLEIRRYHGFTDMDAESGKVDKRGFSKGKRYIVFSLGYHGPYELEPDRSEICDYRWVEPHGVDIILVTTRPEKRNLLLIWLSNVNAACCM